MATLSKKGGYFLYFWEYLKDKRPYTYEYIKPFRATQENIDLFNQGCRIMAEELTVFIDTNNFVPSKPFGELTYDKKSTENLNP